MLYRFDTRVSDGFSHNSKEPEAEPDSTYGGKSIRELYELASTNYCGKYSCTYYGRFYWIKSCNCLKMRAP
ncbi:hypothetical protein EUGRSUZ_E01848 [Eucalyptus grandis]|uniref:Uncharacterized protein n=2 Tax=Eucalyptus grandis TaxID=71139 RepID=A0ACC3KVT4_EUCGR|nr:hypothetical protein EUGRSUZ_E01848 [Eucalyptus grandis]